MSFQQLDLTLTDAEQEKNSFSVYRRPNVFSAKQEESDIRIKDKKGQEHLISKSVFESKFKIWNENGEKGFCIEPKKSSALQIKKFFFISKEDIDGNEERLIGNPGDYLITRESGENEICKQEDLGKKFINEQEFFLMSEKNIEKNTPSLTIK